MNIKKLFYFLKFRLNTSKIVSKLFIVESRGYYPKFNEKLSNRQFEINNCLNPTNQNSVNNKYYIITKKNNSNLNREYFSNNRKRQQKSVYSKYINLNRTQNYYNCDEISHFSTCKINNFNNSMLIKNNSKDKKYIVKIKLSSSHPNIRNKNNFDNKKKTYIIEYSSDATNKENNLSKKAKYKHYYSYKNISALNNSENGINNYCHTCYSNNNIFNLKQNKSINQKKNNIVYNNLLNSNTENNFNTKNKLIDQQILDYLNRNNLEKKSLIKRMKNTYSNIDNINLNNYSYINNNNYYNNQNLYFNHSNNYELNNKDNKSRITNRENGLPKNEIYSNYIKERVKKFDNKKNPLKIHYANENINIENMKDSEPLNNINENLTFIKTCNGIMKIDYPIGRNKMPIPSSRIYSTKNIKICNRKINNTVEDINYKNENIIKNYSTDKTLASNYTLNGSKLVKKYKKSKIKENKNIIQKSLNLFYCNENKTRETENIIATNIKNINNKNSINGKIIIGINHRKNNSPISAKNNDKKINEIKKLKISHKVINELFNNKKNINIKNEKNKNEKENENLRFSMQSMNDSKIMEMANNYISDEKVNRDEIKEILNSKKEK